MSAVYPIKWICLFQAWRIEPLQRPSEKTVCS